MESMSWPLAPVAISVSTSAAEENASGDEWLVARLLGSGCVPTFVSSRVRVFPEHSAKSLVGGIEALVNVLDVGDLAFVYLLEGCANGFNLKNAVQNCFVFDSAQRHQITEQPCNSTWRRYAYLACCFFSLAM